MKRAKNVAFVTDLARRHKPGPPDWPAIGWTKGGFIVTYALALGDVELARYRFMATRARVTEDDLWTRVGIVPGARVADVGCGPGSVLAVLAEIAGPDGHVSGVDGEPQAINAARTVLEGSSNVDLRVGRADETGLEPGSYDVVMMRHVLAHNGGLEQAIVDHLASLVRPGGYLYVVDVDLSMLRISPAPDDLGDIFDRYVEFHRSRGNDPHVGLRLGSLLRSAGLDPVEERGRFDISPLPIGM